MDDIIKILILEHDPNDLELLQRELKKAALNYVSEIVSTEHDFENALKAFVPDVILADYSLPGFSGVAAFHIKEKMLPETPFIFVSGTIGDENAVELIKTGVTDYALKDKLFVLPGKILRALKESKDKKEKHVAEENLVSAYKELKTFIYKSSHDLRGPLSSILGLLNLAKMEVKDEKALTYFETVNRFSLRLDEILKRLVNIMSIRDSDLVLDLVNVQDLLDEVFESVQHLSGYEKIKFTVNNEIHELIYSNRELLSSIVHSLVENAVIFHDYDLPQPAVEVHIWSGQKGMIKMEVHDNGTGMSDEVKQQVFDMFYKGTYSPSGLGLGLYLVKTTVEKLGGTIKLKSNQGSGSTFTIAIPQGHNKPAIVF